MEESVPFGVADLRARLQVIQAVMAFDFGAQELNPGSIRLKLRGLQTLLPGRELSIKGECGLRR